MLDLRKIRYFVSVFEEGSMSRAAERENIVQPALSVHIRQLEEELGIKLFDRSAQGVQPTPAGQMFHRICIGILHNLRDARQQMLDLGGTVSGSIRIGLMPSICRGLLGTIRDLFTDTLPLVETKLLEATSSTLASQVVAGNLDLAICNRPASQTGLKLRLLYRDRVILASGSAREFAAWQDCRLDQIEALRLVLPSRENTIRRLLDKHLKSHSIKPLRVLEIDGLGATMQFIAGSAWSTPLPSVAVLNDIDSPSFILNPISRPGLTSDIYEMHMPERPPSLPAQRFVELVEQQLQLVPGIIQSHSAT